MEWENRKITYADFGLVENKLLFIIWLENITVKVIYIDSLNKVAELMNMLEVTDLHNLEGKYVQYAESSSGCMVGTILDHKKHITF